MSVDKHVRAALDQMILREHVRLRAHFTAPVASALGRYFAETVERGGLPSDETLRALAGLLAPYGLADPEGQGRHPPLAKLPDIGNIDPVADEYRRSDLRAHGVGLDVFRSEWARRNRESPRPVTPGEVAAALAQNASPRLARAPLARLGRAARGLRRLRP